MDYSTLKLHPYKAWVGYLDREQRHWGCSRKDRAGQCGLLSWTRGWDLTP